MENFASSKEPFCQTISARKSPNGFSSFWIVMFLPEIFPFRLGSSSVPLKLELRERFPLKEERFRTSGAIRETDTESPLTEPRIFFDGYSTSPQILKFSDGDNVNRHCLTRMKGSFFSTSRS